MGGMEDGPRPARALYDVTDEVLAGQLTNRQWTAFANWLLTEKQIDVTVQYPQTPLSLVLEMFQDEFLIPTAVQAVADEIVGQTGDAEYRTTWLLAETAVEARVGAVRYTRWMGDKMTRSGL